MGDAAATADVLRAQLRGNSAKIPLNPPELTHKAIDRRIWEEIVRPSVRHPELLPSGEVEWLDWGRKFYRGPDKLIRLAFGKHKDEPAGEHLDYVEWILSADFARDTKQVATAIIAKARGRAPN